MGLKRGLEFTNRRKPVQDICISQSQRERRISFTDAEVDLVAAAGNGHDGVFRRVVVGGDGVDAGWRHGQGHRKSTGEIPVVNEWRTPCAEKSILVKFDDILRDISLRFKNVERRCGGKLGGLMVVD